LTRTRCQEIFEHFESVQFLNGMSKERNCLCQLLNVTNIGFISKVKRIIAVHSIRVDIHAREL
jgi:hypothetical protein